MKYQNSATWKQFVSLEFKPMLYKKLYKKVWDRIIAHYPPSTSMLAISHPGECCHWRLITRLGATDVQPVADVSYPCKCLSVLGPDVSYRWKWEFKCPVTCVNPRAHLAKSATIHFPQYASLFIPACGKSKSSKASFVTKTQIYTFARFYSRRSLPSVL